jgi:hypothetical protein
LGLRYSAKGKRNKSQDWGVCGFEHIKTLAQFSGNKICYLKILQIQWNLFDWKPSWTADLRFVQGGLHNKIHADKWPKCDWITDLQVDQDGQMTAAQWPANHL